MSSISREQVSHLAMLARIDLTGDELTRLAGELQVILSAVEQVGEVASQDVPAMSHPIAMTNVFRADEPAASLTPEQALAAAPESDGTRFVVPRILGED